MWKIPDIIDAYMSVYCDNNPSSSLRRAMAILRKDTVKEVMSSLMKDRLENIGVDDDYVASKYKNFIEDIDAPASTRLQALNRVSDILGHVKKKRIKQNKQYLCCQMGIKNYLRNTKTVT